MTPLQAALTKIDVLTNPADWVLAATLRGLMRGYHARWCGSQSVIEIVECETAYRSPLVNLDTGRSSRSFTVAGKVDKIVRINGQTYLYDHKTTSSDITDPSNTYWRQLAIDSQASHYELLLLANGIRLDGVVWDVTRKPAIRPKEITIADHKAVLATETYCGFNVSQETMDYLIDTRRENEELFELRVARDSIDDPDKFFARRSVPRTRDQLVEYAQELWQVAGDIRDANKSNLHYRNSGACFNYGRPCPYLNLCAGADVPTSDRWRPKAKKHSELPDWIGGDNVLTNSRLRCFQSCRRLHHYKYGLGIEPNRDDQEEALYFGSLYHEALDTWWTAFNQEMSDGNCSEQPSRRDGSRQAEAGLAG